MVFLTNAKKLKTIRIYLKMKQEDLVDENITRGLISMIETGKREISNNVALKIYNKFEQKAKLLDIELKIDSGFLLRSPSEDAELYCLKKLNEINKDTDIKEIIEIADKFNLLKINVMAYAKLGEFFFYRKDYNQAFVNYNYAIDIFKKIK
ncbi:helix-turn-helix domain-containing protein [Clostridium frigoris]|uniref:Helix-turn-helix domain-containing protein n=1 Tax=Clostridium frigoris TaxID=205327 RepID=A0ABS6BTR4_9CLOT|nr:helix-turn-helix transcriptional regulator [Clostridium frigoris]MBU3160309.1 helix-turn-helix domain-containing protein [Clostridium frigoris]